MEKEALTKPKPINQETLDRHFSKDVNQWAKLERTSTLNAIVKDQEAVERILDDEKRAPRDSAAPPELRRMSETFSSDEMKILDAKAQQQHQVVEAARQVAKKFGKE